MKFHAYYIMAFLIKLYYNIFMSYITLQKNLKQDYSTKGDD